MIMSSITMSDRMLERGEPIARPDFCLYIDAGPESTANWKNPFSKIIWIHRINVFFGIRVCGDILFQTLFNDFVTSLCGIEVYNAVTSKEIMMCWSGMEMLFMVLANTNEFLIVHG